MNALLILSALFLQNNDDVVWPTGTPFEWLEEYYQPTPLENFWQAPPLTSWGVYNIATFYGIKSQDIIRNMQITLPKRQHAPALGRWSSGLSWDYPPSIPVELEWAGVTIHLRQKFHRHMLSFQEAEAFLVWHGDPSLVHSNATDMTLEGKIRIVMTELQKSAPQLPSGNSVKDMIRRVVTVEMTDGYAQAWDPTFAPRTLWLGKEAWEALLELANGSNALAARNAVLVLAGFPDSSPTLREIVDKTKDSVVRLRALFALIRRRDSTIADYMMTQLNGKDESLAAMCVYGLGKLKHKAAAVRIADIAKRHESDENIMTTCLGALARIHDPATLPFLRAVRQKMEADISRLPKNEPQQPKGFSGFGGLGGGNADPVGTELRTMQQLALIAVAACGDEKTRDGLIEILEKNGLKYLLPPTHFVLVDVLPVLGAKGVQRAKDIVSSGDEMRLRLAALEHFTGDAQLLQRLADNAAPAIRMRALALLYALDAKAGVKAATAVLDKYVDGELEQVNEAALTIVAVQILAKEKQTTKFAAALKEALKAKMWAKRIANDDLNVTKSTVEITPPLVEALLQVIPAEAHEIVLPILKDKTSPVRAQAAFACKSDAAVEALLDGLKDPGNGWLRFACARSLAALSGQDSACDWIFSGEETVEQASKKFRDWVKSRK